MKKIYVLCLCALSATEVSHAQIINTIAGSSFVDSFAGDGGAATAAMLNQPAFVAIDKNNDLFISDHGNLRVRKVAADGTITTIAGNGTAVYAGDGVTATATGLYGPEGIAVDNSNNVYVADGSVIRKISSGGIISTFAGQIDSAGYAGDGGPATASLLGIPMGIAMDAAGNLYYADRSISVVRKINTSGIISTIAGVGAETHSDTTAGMATTKGLFDPMDVAVDGAGNIYVTDQYNEAIRKVDTSGMMYTITGGAITMTFAPGPATASGIDFPNGICVDAHGNIYISGADAYIYRIDPAGNISILCGNGTYGFSGDGGPFIDAEINSYATVRTDTANNLIIADPNNNRVRRVTELPATGPLSAATISNKTDITVYPDPSSGLFSVRMHASAGASTISITDILGRTIQTQRVPPNITIVTVDITDAPKGTYLVKVQNGGINEIRKVTTR